MSLLDDALIGGDDQYSLGYLKGNNDEKTGGAVKYNHNVRNDFPKDEIINKFIPDNISVCALHRGKNGSEPCVSDTAVAKIGEIVKVSGTPEEIMRAASEKLNCKTGPEGEICVLKKLERDLGTQLVRGEIAVNYKISGPTDSKLLSNINLDDQMQQWMAVFPEFFAYNFNMLNYASYKFRHGRVISEPDTLATIKFADLVTGKYDPDDIPFDISMLSGTKSSGEKLRRRFKCAGCIINKDTYQGAGTHWMALFADVRGGRYTVEFFNSSGNAPNSEWVNWMEKTKIGIEGLVDDGILPRLNKSPQVEIMNVSNIRHQKSKSECGLYSLFYIWARLNGVPPEYFATSPVSDQHMFEFRQHLFRDPNRKPIGEFKWGEYQNQVNIKWESDA